MPKILSILWQLLGLVMVGVLWKTLDAPFVYDDKIEVIGNTTIRYLEQWQAIIEYNRARILLQLSYAANYAQAGLEPKAYHITNLLIHFFCMGGALWMVFNLGRLCRHHSPVWVAAYTVTLWALHPMTTESVIYVTGRSESLCALFSFVAIGAWAFAINGRSMYWRLVGIFFCVAAMMSKEVGIVIPIIFAIMDMTLAKEANRKWQFAVYSLLLGLLLFATGMRAWTVQQALMENNETVGWLMVGAEIIPQEVPRPLSVRLTTQAEVWLRYVGLWLMPVKQTIYHHIPDAEFGSVRGFSGVGIWIVTMAAMWRFSSHNKLARIGLIAMFLVLLPSSSIASLKENMAEHRSHQMGLFLMLFIAAMLPPLSKKYRFFPLLLLIPLSVLTYLRGQVWQSEVALWEEATMRNPEIGEAWYGLGDAHRFADDFEQATSAFQRCVQLDPDYLDGWNNLGIVYAETGQYDKAEIAWKALLRKDKRNCRGHNNLGSLAFQMQNWETAQGEFISTIQYCPDNVIAHYGLGNLYYGPLSVPRLAAHHYQMVIDIEPTFVYAAEARKRLLELTW